MTQRHISRKLPIPSFNDHYAWPSPQSWRNRIHNAKEVIRKFERGEDADPEDVEAARRLLKCVVWAFGRVFIDEDAYLEWLEDEAVGWPVNESDAPKEATQ